MTTTAHGDVPTTGESLATEILARRRRRLPAVTAVLVLAVVAGAAVFGGVELQKHYGSASSSGGSGGTGSLGSGRAGSLGSTFSRFGRSGSGARTGGSGGLGFFGGAGGGGGAAGTVTLIKGSTLYVTSAAGTTVLVHTTPSSRVTKTVQGTVQTIHPGDSVVVVGTQAKNGSYTASSIAIGGASNG